MDTRFLTPTTVLLRDGPSFSLSWSRVEGPWSSRGPESGTEVLYSSGTLLFGTTHWSEKIQCHVTVETKVNPERF